MTLLCGQSSNLHGKNTLDFYRAMLCLSATYMYVVMRCPSVTFVHSVKTNRYLRNFFTIDSGGQTILVFPYQTSWQYSDVNPQTGASNAGACGRQKSRFWANNWLHRMLWTLRRPAAINTIVGRYLAIDRCLLELVLSPDVRPSIGVSQSRCKSVYGTESHAPVNTPKRIEHNLIYAAVYLTPEYNW